MPRKVLVISYYFPPSGGAGVQRWLKFVKYLPAWGVEPVVLTVDPRYASYPQQDESLCREVPKQLRVFRTPTREILSFYKKVSPTGEIPYGGFAGESHPNLLQKMARFIRGNFFLPDPRRGWNRYAFREACRLIETEAITTVLTTSPPHSTQLIGLQLKRTYPYLRWVADLRDPWSEIYYNRNLYQSVWAKHRNTVYERSVLQAADYLLTVSPACADLFAAKADIRAKLSVLPNGYDEVDFHDLPSLPVSDKFVLSYVGTLSPVYETTTLLQALQVLPPSVKQSLLLRWVGAASPSFRAAAEATGVAVEWITYRPHQEAIAYMQAADALLLLLPDTPEAKGIYTGKLFEYMASGTPVWLIGQPEGDAAALLRETRTGRAFCTGDVGALCAALQQAVQFPTQQRIQPPPAYSRRALTEQLVHYLFPAVEP